MTLPPGWQADIIKGLGGTHTPAAEHLLGAWQQWEGGGTANDASFNPLNTTRGKYKSINSVGVQAFPDWQTGIKETVGTLGGYPAISWALKTGEIDFSDPALQADLNKWLTGKSEAGMTPYVAKIARSFGQDVPLAETRALTNSSVPPPPAPVQEAKAEEAISLMDIALGKKSIMDMFFQRKPAPAARSPVAATSPSASTSPAAGAGKLIDLSAGVSSPTHVTDGLGWGTKTAVDIMASPGTPVGAPVAGTVMRLGSAQGGDSMYFKGDDGITRWLGHIDSNFSLKPGTHVEAGQILTRVSADHKAPHLHYDSGRS